MPSNKFTSSYDDPLHKLISPIMEVMGGTFVGVSLLDCESRLDELNHERGGDQRHTNARLLPEG